MPQSHPNNLARVFKGTARVLYVVQEFESFEAEGMGVGVGVGVEGLHGSEVVFSGSGVVKGCELCIFTFLDVGFDQDCRTSAFAKCML